MSGLLQLSGALMVLAAFVAVQSGVARSSSRATLALNLIGSAVLAVLALSGREWGFLLLEGTWSVVSAAALAREMARRRNRVSGEALRCSTAKREPHESKKGALRAL